MTKNWTLHHSDSVEKSRISFPEKTAPNPFPQQILLKVEKKTKVFYTKKRRGSSGNQLFISDQVLKQILDGTAVVIESISERKLRLIRLWVDNNKRIAVYGLIISIIGMIIGASFKIGESTPIFWISNGSITIWFLVSLICEIIGVILVFYKGVYLGSE